MKKNFVQMCLAIYALLFLFSFAASASTGSSVVHPWPVKTIPYSFERVPKDIQKIIEKAIDRINSLGIVKFSPGDATEETNFTSVIFVSSEGICSSTYGWGQESSTMVRVSKFCTYGNVLHELLHSLGIMHEQLNPLMKFPIYIDRVTINWEDQYVNKEAFALTDHDPHSIMHYHSFANSICGEPDSSKWKDLPVDRLPPASCRNKDWQNLRAENNHGVDCQKECSIFWDPATGAFGGERVDLSPLDIEGLRKRYSHLPK